MKVMNPSHNKGFSLLEMIIAISILAIVAAIGAYSIVYVNNANVGNAANKLEAAFTTARVTSMAKGPEVGRLTLYYDDGVFSYTIGDDTNKEEICSFQIAVRYATNESSFRGTSFSSQLPESFKEVIYFNSAGMIINNKDAADSYSIASPGALIDPEPKKNHNNCYYFTKGDRTIAVMIYPITGKVETKLM